MPRSAGTQATAPSSMDANRWAGRPMMLVRDACSASARTTFCELENPARWNPRHIVRGVEMAQVFVRGLRKRRNPAVSRSQRWRRQATTRKGAVALEVPHGITQPEPQWTYPVGGDNVIVKVREFALALKNLCWPRRARVRAENKTAKSGPASSARFVSTKGARRDAAVQRRGGGHPRHLSAKQRQCVRVRVCTRVYTCV